MSLKIFRMDQEYIIPNFLRSCFTFVFYYFYLFHLICMSYKLELKIQFYEKWKFSTWRTIADKSISPHRALHKQNNMYCTQGYFLFYLVSTKKSKIFKDTNSSFCKIKIFFKKKSPKNLNFK